jgi:hypothetical protein
MKGIRPGSMPLEGIPLLSGPPPPSMSAWRIRLHLWPFVVLAGFYPALALVRFLRPIQPELSRQRVLPLLLGFLFTLLSILCVVACIGIAGVWFRTGRTREQGSSTSCRWAGGGPVYRTFFFAGYGGRMGLGQVVSAHPATVHSWEDHRKLCQGLWPTRSGTMLASPENSWARKLGFALESGSSPGGSPSYSHWWIGVPCWPFILATAVPPICWVRWFRRRKTTRQRMTQGLCLKCGYNLTGNVSGVCPECGKKVLGAPGSPRG